MGAAPTFIRLEIERFSVKLQNHRILINILWYFELSSPINVLSLIWDFIANVSQLIWVMLPCDKFRKLACFYYINQPLNAHAQNRTGISRFSDEHTKPLCYTGFRTFVSSKARFFSFTQYMSYSVY